MAALLLLWEQFDEVIDAKDGDGGLCGKFEALSLDHSRLVHTSLAVVSGLAIHKVQTNPEGRDSKVESEFNICVKTKIKTSITEPAHGIGHTGERLGRHLVVILLPLRKNLLQWVVSGPELYSHPEHQNGKTLTI